MVDIINVQNGSAGGRGNAGTPPSYRVADASLRRSIFRARTGRVKGSLAPLAACAPLTRPARSRVLGNCRSDDRTEPGPVRRNNVPETWSRVSASCTQSTGMKALEVARSRRYAPARKHGYESQRAFA
jgi:hypothetical protein